MLETESCKEYHNAASSQVPLSAKSFVKQLKEPYKLVSLRLSDLLDLGNASRRKVPVVFPTRMDRRMARKDRPMVEASKSPGQQ